MEKTLSFLFAGTHFDRKCFAKDISRFKAFSLTWLFYHSFSFPLAIPCESLLSVLLFWQVKEQQDLPDSEHKESKLIKKDGSKKEKRKRNMNGSGSMRYWFSSHKKSFLLFACYYYFFCLDLWTTDVVEGFDVFKSSKSLKTKESKTHSEDDSMMHIKELQKRIEVWLFNSFLFWFCL